MSLPSKATRSSSSFGILREGDLNSCLIQLSDLCESVSACVGEEGGAGTTGNCPYES